MPATSRRQVNVSLQGELGEKLTRYHESLVAAGQDGTLPDTIRQILAEAIAARPETAQISASSQRAFLRVGNWARQRLAMAISQMQSDLRNEIAALPHETCPHCGHLLDAADPQPAQE